MADNNLEPDYVNDLPKGYLADAPRCQYRFEHSYQYKEQDVKGRRCGLPVPNDDTGRREQLCYLHSYRSREHDQELKGKLEAICRLYLGEAQMAGGLLRDADLVYARLPWANLDTADLSGACLWHADLSGAYLWGGVDLSGTVLASANLSGAVLWAAIIRPLHRIRTDVGQVVTEVPDLRGANFTGALLGEATIAPEADLSNAKWGSEGHGHWSQYHIQDERSARCDKEWDKVATPHGLSGAPRPGFDESQIIYRQLKLNYQESGDYQTAGEFFVREMECKRAQMVQDKKQAAPFWGRAGLAFLLLPAVVALVLGLFHLPAHNPWWISLAVAFAPFVFWAWPMRERAVWGAMYFLAGYGERPAWIGKWGLGLIGVFGFIHAWLGLADGTGGNVVNAGLTLPTWSGFCQWCTALYFSVVTFTSLGYGDLQPASTAGRFFASLEAVLGVVLMSLFLICIVRKYSR